jgi:Glycosyltransferases involved in cell wall biogenesis
MNPLVSIIVPCYNHGHLLKSALTAVQHQTLSDWECIIVDDGSSDNTSAIAGEFVERDKRFHYIKQENKGLSEARNTGIIRSKGDYIQLLDADDLLSEDKLLLQTSFMKAHDTILISYTDADYFPEDDLRTKYKQVSYAEEGIEFNNQSWIRDFGDYPSFINHIVKANIAPVNSMLIKRSVFNIVGLFDRKFLYLEDWEFWTRCAFKGVCFKFFNESRARAFVRVNKTGMSVNRYKMDLYYLVLSRRVDQLLKDNTQIHSHFDFQSYKYYRKVWTRNLFRSVGLRDWRRLFGIARAIGWSEFLLYYAKESVFVLRSSLSRSER